MNEQVLGELIRMQMDIKETVEVQQLFISRLQMLMENNSLLSNVFDSLPFPIAIFRQNGALCMANRVLMEEAGINSYEISAGKINLLNRITNENYSVLEAAEDTFAGRTTLLKKLASPLALFCRIEGQVSSNEYKSAIFFPVSDNTGPIKTGAVMLLK